MQLTSARLAQSRRDRVIRFTAPFSAGPARFTSQGLTLPARTALLGS